MSYQNRIGETSTMTKSNKSKSNCKLCDLKFKNERSFKIHNTRKHQPKPTDMLFFYNSPSVHCMKCNLDIGDLRKVDNCPNCGYDIVESLTNWIHVNAKWLHDF